MHTLVITCAVFLLAALAVCGGPYSEGLFFAVDSFDGDLKVWNATSNASFASACSLGRTVFTPAYTIDDASRSFYYLFAVGDESRLVSWPFQEQSNGTVACGDKTDVCLAKWRANSTALLAWDQGLQHFIMLDEFLTPGSNEEYVSRLWRFAPGDCELQLMDTRDIAPYLLRSEDSYAYDRANHRFYSVYRENVDTPFRIRAMDMSASSAASSLLYDKFLPVQPHDGATPFMTFDLSTGSLVLLLLSEPELYSVLLLQPVTFIAQPLPSSFVPGTMTPRATTDLQFDWRQSLLVMQRPIFNSTNYEQNVFNFGASLTFNTSFEFDYYVDYGWQYDPVQPVQAVAINTASQQQLMAAIPSMTEAAASTLIRQRPYTTVDQLRSVVGFQTGLYERSRPYLYL